MLITFLTTGTRGDIQPYIALGLAIKKAGHDVRIAGFENYAGFVTGNGLIFFPIHGDVSAVAAGQTGQTAMRADNPLKVLLSFRQMQRLVFDLQEDFYEACLGSDAVVYHPGAAIGYFAAQELGIPSILATPFPMKPTGDFPALIFYNAPRLGRWMNLLAHRITEQIFWSASSGPVKQFWRQRFGRNPARFGNPFPRQVTRTHPTIISCSNAVFPRPSDWPADVHNTGYWFLDDAASYEPPADLLDFLQRGAAPVYVGFGSMSNAAASEQTTRQVIEGLQLAGQRGVLATGWNGLARIENLPETIYILDSAPHAWLFPRMAAVVHHGGAGTTAAGLRAGIPSVIIPGGNDQPAWGRRVYELGAGSRPIPRKDFNAGRLAAALKTALLPEIRAGACRIGEQIRREDGAGAAAQVIIRAVEAYRRGS